MQALQVHSHNLDDARDLLRVCHVWLEVAMKASSKSNGSPSDELANVSGVKSQVCGNKANRLLLQYMHGQSPPWLRSPW
jgi:hypothetical protein